MKANRIFIVVIIALMAVILLFEMNAPARFNWNDDSHSYKSKQPFGCYVMDSVLRASLPQGYEVLGNGIYKYTGKKYKGGKHTFLFTNNCDKFISSIDVDFCSLIKEGNNVVLAVDECTLYGYDYDDYLDGGNGKICKQLGFSNYITYTYINDNKETLSDPTQYNTVNWNSRDMFAPASYPINRVFYTHGLLLSSDYRILATLDWKRTPHEEHDTVAGIRDYGKGKVVVVSMPLLFTNYGILNDTIRPLALRLLSECGNLPIVRYDPSLYNRDVDNVDDDQESESPLRYLLANRPLRWALYLALATLVAFVTFTARRRQRVIPVIKPPVNHMMDFVKRIGDIYFKRHDNVDLLNKKYVTFSNDLRVKAMIDIDNDDNIDDELLSLSNRTGIPLNELQQHIRDVKDIVNADRISDKQLQQFIDMMNDIMHRINI